MLIRTRLSGWIALYADDCGRCFESRRSDRAWEFVERIISAGPINSSRPRDCSLRLQPGSWRANPDEETTDWRAVCGRTARTVRRAGTAKAVSDPYREQESTSSRPIQNPLGSKPSVVQSILCPESFFPAWNGQRVNDRIGNLAVEDREHALCRHSLTCLRRAGVGADIMQCENQPIWIDLTERVFHRHRLLIEYIECGAGDDFFIQSLDNVGFFDCGSAGSVDNKCCRLHELELAHADHAARLSSQYYMQCD